MNTCDFDRRRFVKTAAALFGGTALAGCASEEPEESKAENEQTPVTTSPSSGSGNGGSSKFGGWFARTENYDEVTDRTGRSTVTVSVGAPDVPGGPYAFGPAAIRVSPGTTVKWKWSGKGGRHNVVATNGAFKSQLYRKSGIHFTHTFGEAGTFKYYCRPHKKLGMRGVVVVE